MLLVLVCTIVCAGVVVVVHQLCVDVIEGITSESISVITSISNSDHCQNTLPLVIGPGVAGVAGKYS
jgi:hypothetical protein